MLLENPGGEPPFSVVSCSYESIDSFGKERVANREVRSQAAAFCSSLKTQLQPPSKQLQFAGNRVDLAGGVGPDGEAGAGWLAMKFGFAAVGNQMRFEVALHRLMVDFE